MTLVCFISSLQPPTTLVLCCSQLTDEKTEACRSSEGCRQMFYKLKEQHVPGQTTIPNKTINHSRWRKKAFHDKIKFKQFLSSNPALQKALERKLQSAEVNYTQEDTRINSPRTANQKGRGLGTHTITTK